MTERLNRVAGLAALGVALLALVFAMASSAGARNPRADRPGAVVRLGRGNKIPARLLPVVPRARRATTLAGQSADDLSGSCAPETVDLGTWCLASAPYPLSDDEIGRNDYAFATKTCVEEGGWLPTAEQLIGAAARVKLASTIDDAQLTANVDVDPTDGTKDRREMSATLVTTAAGSSAAGSMGVTEGSRGDPEDGRAGPGPAAREPVPGDAAVRDRLRQQGQGRLRRRQADQPARDVPLRVREAGGRGEERGGLSPARLTRSSARGPAAG